MYMIRSFIIIFCFLSKNAGYIEGQFLLVLIKSSVHGSLCVVTPTLTLYVGTTQSTINASRL